MGLIRTWLENLNSRLLLLWLLFLGFIFSSLLGVGRKLPGKGIYLVIWSR